MMGIFAFHDSGVQEASLAWQLAASTQQGVFHDRVEGHSVLSQCSVSVTQHGADGATQLDVHKTVMIHEPHLSLSMLSCSLLKAC